MKRMTVLGCYDLDENGAIIRRPVNLNKVGDYGHNGMRDDGTFQMVPSGDIVDAAEMHRRLAK